MSTKILFPLALLFGLSAAAFSVAQSPANKPSPVELPAEKHLRNVRQLTNGGENAEAYFSADGRSLIFQSKRDGARVRPDLHDARRRLRRADGLDGQGAHDLLLLLPDPAGAYSTPRRTWPTRSARRRPTTRAATSGPSTPRTTSSRAKPNGTDVKRLTDAPGYDAEATVSPDGKKIVFTSMRDGDLDIYTMDADGKNVKRLTNELGYDGGPFFSRDGKQIVYRANHPQTPEQLARYKKLLAENLIEPNALEIWVMDADGRNKRQVTKLGVASFAPYFLPDGKRIIFSSNHPNPRGRDFDLFVVDVDGTGLEQVTFNDTFDGFPMFSPDGRKLVFASNRNAAARGDTNVFIADWVE